MNTLELKNLKKLAALAVLAAIAIVGAGCSGDDSPMGVDAANNETPPPVVIKTPKTVIIDEIKVTRFSAKRANGDDWDWDPFSAGPRRPDIRVSLQRSGYTPAYNSDTRDNAYYNRSYKFTEPASVYDGHLPHSFSYGTAYKVYLVDDDFGGDETMHSATVKGSALYGKDNATSFTKTIYGTRDFRIVVTGRFKY